MSASAARCLAAAGASLALVVVAGCSSSGGGDDGAVAPGPDGGTSPDAAPLAADGSPPAVDAGHTVEEDAGTSGAWPIEGDGGPASDPICQYAFDRQVIVRCPKQHAYVNHYVSAVAGCEPVWSIGGKGPPEPTAREAALAVGCDASCIWEAHQAVMFVHCGARNEYLTYRAPGCDDLYAFPQGIYTSVEAYHQAYPCPP